MDQSVVSFLEGNTPLLGNVVYFQEIFLLLPVIFQDFQEYLSFLTPLSFPPRSSFKFSSTSCFSSPLPPFLHSISPFSLNFYSFFMNIFFFLLFHSHLAIIFLLFFLLFLPSLLSPHFFTSPSPSLTPSISPTPLSFLKKL